MGGDFGCGGLQKPNCSLGFPGKIHLVKIPVDVESLVESLSVESLTYPLNL